MKISQLIFDQVSIREIVSPHNVFSSVDVKLEVLEILEQTLECSSIRVTDQHRRLAIALKITHESGKTLKVSSRDILIILGAQVEMGVDSDTVTEKKGDFQEVTNMSLKCRDNQAALLTSPLQWPSNLCSTTNKEI